MGTIATHEYELLLSIADHLQSTLDLKRAIDLAAPLLQRLVGAEHVAIAISRPGTLYDYEWYNTTLPERFLGSYVTIAERDFVRKAVAVEPSRVLVDQQMLTRREYDRHIVSQHARATGANLEHVMAVMLCHEQEWSSGLALYRDRKVPFTAHEAALLQRVVPQISSAVRNSRAFGVLQHEGVGSTLLEHTDAAILWLSEDGSELARTPAATRALQAFFAAHERPVNALPQVLRDFAKHAMAQRETLPYTRESSLGKLQVSAVPLPERRQWALIFEQTGLRAELATALSPRLAVIAGYLLRGLSDKEIAEKEGRALATIKQQAGEVYDRLGVDGRNGLLALVSGFRT